MKVEYCINIQYIYNLVLEQINSYGAELADRMD